MTFQVIFPMSWHHFQLPYSRIILCESQISHPLQKEMVPSAKRRKRKAIYQILNLTLDLAMKAMLMIPPQTVIVKTVIVLILKMSKRLMKKMCNDMLLIENICFIVLFGINNRLTWIVQKYIDYVESHYGKSSIVFDGNQDGPSTKDHEHARRAIKSKPSPEDISQQAFQANS